jgi:hypothetical protein
MSHSNFSKTFSLCFGVLAMVFILNYLVLAWTEPSSNPPNNNVSAPLNVGSAGQSKAGGLILNTGGASIGLVVDKGNVGIGITNPTEKLYVSGKIFATDDVCIASGVCLSHLIGYAVDPNKIVMNKHTINECVAAGGEAVDVGAQQKGCRFSNLNGVTCAPGWTQYLNWTTTNSVGDGVYCCCFWVTGACVKNCQDCVTGSHTWSNTVPETCLKETSYSASYYDLYCSGQTWSTQTAKITQVGCY